LIPQPDTWEGMREERHEKSRAFCLLMSKLQTGRVFGNSGFVWIFDRNPALSKMLQGLKKLVEKDFNDLDGQEQELISNVDELVKHKLIVQTTLKVNKQKIAEYERKGWDEDTMKKIGWLHGATIANSWGLDPEKTAEKWAEIS
ncbi:hypothetical protein PENTCL1PPCAC_16054, partial [Pristionchus entomophagus]